MTIIDVFLLLLLAAICGGLAQVIAGYSRGGLIVAMVLGFIGAYSGDGSLGRCNCPSRFLFELAMSLSRSSGPSSAPPCSWPLLAC